MLQFSRPNLHALAQSPANFEADYTSPFSDDPAHTGPELPTVKRTFDVFESNGRRWDLQVSGLARRGLTVELDEVYFCDGRDQLSHPITYRLHLYPGASRGSSVPLTEKIARMKGWQDAILTFDEIMEPGTTHHSMESLVSLIESGRIARAEIAVLETANPSLRKLFNALGFTVSPEPPHPYIARWSDIVSAAKSGLIVSEWLKQKG
jgi:hypothetical protein